MQVVSVTPVVGLPQVNGWSQIIDHVYDGIHLVASIAVEGEAAGNVGREIVNMVLEQEPKNAQHVYEFLEYLVQFAEQQGCDLSLTLGLIINNRCILSSHHGTVWLKRGDKIGALVEATTEVALIEGSAQLDDTFIFTTQSGRQFLPTVEQQFAQGFDVDGVITALVPVVHSLENSSLNAFAFVTITKRRTEQESVPSTNEKPRSSVQPTQSYIPKRQQETTQPEEIDELEPTSPPEEELADEVLPSLPPATAGMSVATLPELQEHEAEAAQKTRQLQLPDFKSWILGIKRPFSRVFSKKTYVGAGVSKRSLIWLLGIAFVVILGLAVGVWYILHLRAERAFGAELVAPFETQITAAQNLADNDPVSAREELETVVTSLVALQAEYDASGRTQVLSAITETLGEAQEVQETISGKEEFSQLPIFYDLRLASSDFITNLVTVQGSTALFVDSQKKQAIALDLNTKQIKSIDLQSLGTVTSVSAQEEDKIALLADGLYTLALPELESPVQIKEEGDSNRAATFINAFATYVYVFNPEKRNIYRYSKADDEYSDPIGWLQSPLGVSFESVRSLMIDGDLWISTDSGEILKFASGRAAEFEILGLEEPFTTTVYLFTQEVTTRLYALEPEQKRLVIMDKNGQFIREVRSDSFASATNLFVSEAVNTAFAVSGSLVYEVAL